jgi:hypothetical protein
LVWFLKNIIYAYFWHRSCVFLEWFNIFKDKACMFNSISNSLKSGIASFQAKMKQPYHSSTLSFRGLLHIVILGLAVFGFLLFFQPFGLGKLDESVQMKLIFGCTAVAFLGLGFCQFLLPLAMKSFYDEHHWTFGRQVFQSLLMLLLVSVSVLIYLSRSGLVAISFGGSLLSIFAIGILPLIAFVFVQHSVHDSKFKRKADELNQKIGGNGLVNSSNPLQVLVFSGPNEKLSLVPNQLIYVKMDEGNAEFYYQNFFGIDKSFMKIEAKVVIEELKGHPQFVPFHADMIINTNAIQRISGSARGYEMAIAKVNDMVKVPRKYRNRVEEI